MKLKFEALCQHTDQLSSPTNAVMNKVPNKKVEHHCFT